MSCSVEKLLNKSVIMKNIYKEKLMIIFVIEIEYIIDKKVDEKIQNLIDQGIITVNQNLIDINNNQTKQNKMKFIDLFSGIERFHQALQSLNCGSILACDGKQCRKNYKNYNIDPHPDVKKLDPNEIDDIDIICGGFPCQAFSNAGKRKLLTTKDSLFDEIIEIAKVKKPKFMFLENVKHIQK